MENKKKIKVDQSNLLLANGIIQVECYDWSNKMLDKHNLDDQLVVSIFSEEFSYFMANEAYK